MTRGTFILITKDKVYISLEFNGDMYSEANGGYGDEALKLLENVKSEEDFSKMVIDFNATHHNYKDEKFVWEHERESIKEWFNFNYSYFGESGRDFNWFSDYLFFKNHTNSPILFGMRTTLMELQELFQNDQEKSQELEKNYQECSLLYKLEPNQTVRFHFGMIEAEDLHLYSDNLIFYTTLFNYANWNIVQALS